MKHASLRMDKLARSSQRLNKTLLLLSGLLMLLSSTCYWAVSRLLESEQQRLELHFARVVEIINEHEVFLRNVVTSNRQSALSLAQLAHPVAVVESLPIPGRTLLKARGLELSLAFSLAYSSGYTSADVRRALALGFELTDYYGGFWARSFYASPQVFVLAPGRASLAIPYAGDQRQHLPLLPQHYMAAVDRLGQLMATPGLLADQRVHWLRSPAPLYDDNLRIVAMIRFDADYTLHPAGTPQQPLALAAVMDTEQIDEFERVLRLSVYNQFTLISPEGDVLMGELGVDDAAPLGLSFNGDGLRFKMKASGGRPWTGLYAITYQNFLRYAKWPLLGLGLTFIAAIILGLWIDHWFKSRIVVPAQRAQDRLAENEAFNRIILHNAPVGLCVVRRYDRQLLLENERAVQWGIASAVTQVLAQHHGDQAPGEMCLLVEGHYLQAVVVASRYDGQDVFLCGCNDVTRHVDENQLLNQARRQATAANEAKTVFLATMSHEIRTPLYGVLGNLELLSLTDLGERQRHYLEIIESSCAVLFQLISNVLDVSKIESGQMALERIPFDPHQLVEDAVASFTATAHNKGLQIDSEIDPAMPALVEGDAGRIRQVLNNLLGNAIKFTDCGRVRLRLTVQERADDSVLVQWQVTDTGKGIPEKAIEHLFKPFYQVSAGEEGGGAGLGLSICSRLSELMGGSMRVVSELGLGSSLSLIVRLPVVESSRTVTPAQFVPSYTQVPSLDVRVLVAEDNPVSQAVMAEQLTALGARPTVVSDGQQALEAWSAQAFDLVITDINMPRLNGYAFTRALREQGVSVPIIGITANALREEGERCLAAGMNAWLVKPLSLGGLRQALISQCRRAAGQGAAVREEDDDRTGWIELSTPMRQLLAETLLADVAQIEQGLAHGDAALVQQRLHSLSGALASVHAKGLYEVCQRLEDALQEAPMEGLLAEQIRALCTRLGVVAQCLLDDFSG